MRRSAFLLPALLISCHGLRSPGPSQDRLLATIPKGADLQVPPAFAADGTTVAFVAHTKEGDWVVHGGWKSRVLDLI